MRREPLDPTVFKASPRRRPTPGSIMPPAPEEPVVLFGALAEMSYDPDDFTIWLRFHMRGRSQHAVAKRAGLDHSTVSRMLKGTRTPHLQTAIRLAKALRSTSR